MRAGLADGDGGLTTEVGGKEPIVTFANRLPVRRSAHGWRSTDGGLVAALRPALDNRRATWVGWDPAGGEVPAQVPGLDVDLRAVTLTRREIEGSYHGFANRTLWPLLHGLVEQPVFEPRWWDAYRAANARFAAADPEQAGLRWIHDYQLMLLPALLRSRATPGPIGFFLHVPFVPPSLLDALPQARQLLRMMCDYDAVGFQTTQHLREFQDCLRSMLGLAPVPGVGIQLDGHTMMPIAVPIGIDARAFARQAKRGASGAATRRMIDSLVGRALIIGVDRLDYSKGLVQRFAAYEHFLEHDPESHGRPTQRSAAHELTGALLDVVPSHPSAVIVDVGPDQTREVRVLVTNYADDPPPSTPITFHIYDAITGERASASDYFRAPGGG